MDFNYVILELGERYCLKLTLFILDFLSVVMNQEGGANSLPPKPPSKSDEAFHKTWQKYS